MIVQQGLVNILSSSEVRANLLLKIYEVNVNEKRFAYTDDLATQVSRDKISRLVQKMSDNLYVISLAIYKQLKNSGSFRNSNPGLVELNLSTETEPRPGKTMCYAVKKDYYPQIEEIKKFRASKTAI